MKIKKSKLNQIIKEEIEEVISEGIYAGTAMPEEIEHLNDVLKDAGTAADLLQRALGHQEQGELQFMNMRRAALQKSRGIKQ